MHAGSDNGAENSWNVRRSHTSPHSEPELTFAALPLLSQQLSTHGGHASIISGPVLCMACAELVAACPPPSASHHAIHRFTMCCQGWLREGVSHCNQASATNAASTIVIVG